MNSTNETTTVAVILVAGMGTRLRPVSDGIPKCLVPVGQETILDRAVRLLRVHGVAHVILGTGYAQDAIERAARSWDVRVSFCRNERYETTQNAISLLECRDAVQGRPFFKLDGDLLFEAEVLSRLDSKTEGLAVAVDRSAKLASEEMKIRLDTSGSRIMAFGKGLNPLESQGESIGIERVDEVWCGPLFEALAEADGAGRTDMYYEDVYSELCGRGMLATAVDVSGLPWMEVDTLEDLERARELFGR